MTTYIHFGTAGATVQTGWFKKKEKKEVKADSEKTFFEKMKQSSTQIIGKHEAKTLLFASKFLVKLTAKSRKWQYAIKKVIEENRKKKAKNGEGSVTLSDDFKFD